MTSVRLQIECVSGDSAQKMKRAFLSNTVGYDVHILLEHHKYFIVITLSTDLP